MPRRLLCGDGHRLLGEGPSEAEGRREAAEEGPNSVCLSVTPWLLSNVPDRWAFREERQLCAKAGIRIQANSFNSRSDRSIVNSESPAEEIGGREENVEP